MKLKVLLPFQVHAEMAEVRRIVVETTQGSFGLLPHRLDCVARLVPGILTYEDAAGEESYMAVDEGMLVKAGDEVLVSVRNAISGADLGQLRASVQREFVRLDAGERQMRAVLARLESGFVRRFTEFHRG